MYYDVHTDLNMLTISEPSALVRLHAILLDNILLAHVIEYRNRRAEDKDRRSSV
jgi:hypothetical protein